jgi:hypothetical protein
MNREQMFGLKVGDTIERSYIGEGNFEAVKITRVFACGITNNPQSRQHGKAFVCLYTQFGERAEMSGSIREDEETFFRLPKIETSVT